ncbi:MAG: hypothetical protein QOF37_1012, partial [Thermoleophilaceae bacterium]|nr:hypothetical protein [Thermoleophilaceae bacterium]
TIARRASHWERVRVRARLSSAPRDVEAGPLPAVATTLQAALRLTVLALAAALLLGVAVPDALARPGEPVAQLAKKHPKKRKALKCRKGQVPVKVNRRKAGCRSLGAAVPPPKAGDSRLLLAHAALTDNLGGLRDRRGRRPPSLKALFHKVNPHAYAALQAAIPQGLTRLDGLAAASPNTYFRPAAGFGPLARVVPDCAKPGAPPPPTSSDSFSSSGGGEKLTATMTLGSQATLGLGIESGDYSIQLKITAGECNRFNAPDCPTAAGLIDATDSSAFNVSLSVAKSGVVLVSKSFSYAGQTRMHAEVDEDARLTFIEIDDTQTANIDLGGTRQQFGPMNLVYTGLRHTRVNMPGGTYEPGHSVVDIAFTVGGGTFGRSDASAAASSVEADLDKSFATLVNKEITNFKNLETDWNQANTCAKIQFTPASGSLKLHQGDTGSFSAQAVADQGGGASPGHWTRIGQENATVNPERSEGANPQFSYQVTNAGTDILVKATYRATTKAGVAQESWTQKTDAPALYLGQVEGTVTFESSTYCHSSQEYNFSGSLHDVYTHAPFSLEHGGGLATGYDESGTGSWVVDPCNSDPGCSYNLEATIPDPGYAQFWQTGDDLAGIHVEVWTSSWTDGPGCGGAGGDSRGGLMIGTGRIPVSELGAETISVPISSRDEEYVGTLAGSGTLTLHRVH